MSKKITKVSHVWIADFEVFTRRNFEKDTQYDSLPHTCDMCRNEADMQSLNYRGKYKYCPECLIELDEV